MAGGGGVYMDGDGVELIRLERTRGEKIGEHIKIMR